MGLKKNRKGTIAMMDALIFIFLISLVGTWLFAFVNVEETEEPMAKTVSDDFFSIEVETKEIMWLSDTKVLPIGTLIAASMNEGRTSKTSEFIHATIEDIIPEVHGYDFTLEYRGNTMHFQRQSDRQLGSEYSGSVAIDGAGDLNYTLKIY